MKVGDKKVCKIAEATLYSNGIQKKIKKEGTVVYIHPKGRYYRVEFDFGNGKKMIEAFPMKGGSLYE